MCWRLRPSSLGARAHRPADLGGDHQLMPGRHFLEQLARDFFRQAAAVDVGRVEEVDAEVDGLAEGWARPRLRRPPISGRRNCRRRPVPKQIGLTFRPVLPRFTYRMDTSRRLDQVEAPMVDRAPAGAKTDQSKRRSRTSDDHREQARSARDQCRARHPVDDPGGRLWRLHRCRVQAVFAQLSDHPGHLGPLHPADADGHDHFCAAVVEPSQDPAARAASRPLGPAGGVQRPFHRRASAHSPGRGERHPVPGPAGGGGRVGAAAGRAGGAGGESWRSSPALPGR